MEERELPVGWETFKIADLAEKVGSGATPRGGQSAYKPEGTPLIRSTNIVFFGFKLDGLAFIDDDQADALASAEVHANDVLLNITGASIGRVTIAPEWASGARVNQHVCIIRALPCIEPKYLSSYLSSPEIQSLIFDKNYGVTRQALTKQQILDLEVPVSPINEQRRIAAKLDATLAAVDACRQRLDGVADLLKRFRQAVLAAATSGELTREWREGRGICDSWDEQPLGNLLSDIRYGTAQKCTYEICGKPVLRIPNILEGSISLEDLKYADFDQKEIDKLAIRSGDLLVIRSNGSLDLVGRTALATDAHEGLLFAGYLIRLRPRQQVVFPGYLLLVLLSPGTRRCIELAARSTSGVNNINSKFLSGLQLGLPALEEQDEIIRCAQHLFTLADQLEARLHAARKVVDRLTPALLAKAFRGELVPQVPNDEPASVLLDRIRAARQAEAGAGKSSWRGRPKAAANPEPINRNAAPAPSEPPP